MSTELFDYASATTEQVLRHEARDRVASITRGLRQLADRLDKRANAFDRTDETSASIVADIVNDYTQGVGAAGSTFWALVRELGRMPDKPSA